MALGADRRSLERDLFSDDGAPGGVGDADERNPGVSDWDHRVTSTTPVAGDNLRTAGQIQESLPTPLAKRLFDIALAGTGLLLSSPVWVVLASAIRLEDGGP